MNDIDQKRIFAQNLNRLLSESGKSQKEVANDLGVSPQTFNTWCQAIALPRMGKVQKLADYFKVGKTDLIDEKNDFIKSSAKGTEIKVYGRVAAGIPIEMIEDIIDTEEIPEEMARTGEFFGLKISGDSMSPTICNGDIVIVRKQEDAESGDIVIATINGDEATCKRLRKYKEGIELIAINPGYDTFEFSNDEIMNKPVRIIGKVVESRRKF